MSSAETNTPYTPEDLLTMPDGDQYELVDGELVEKPVGYQASYVATRLCFFIQQFVLQNGLGWPIVEGSYQCFAEDPSRVRKPDVSFVAKDRMPENRLPQGHCAVAPDLAVEVISPTNRFSDMERKVQEYLRAGVRLVWVVDPPSRTIHAYRPGDTNVRQYYEFDTLIGEDVLPGFQCAVSEIFETPE